MSDNDTIGGGDATLVTPPAETDLEILKKHLHPKYAVEKKLGSGGMADVYLGFHNQLKRKVAIKVLPRMFARDQGMVQRFLQEAESAAQLEHPNIISIYDIGVADALNYFIMAFVPGGSLKDRLRREKMLHVDAACRIVVQICNALQYAHSKGVIHRDIKPDNIMFDEHHNAILTDFGIAKAKFASRMTATGTLVGTPHYMSPEQLKGAEIDGRSDIYSLGIMFYEILTGRVPFEGEDTYSVGLKHIQEPPVPPLELNPDIPEPLNNIILTMLAKTPAARFQNAADVAQAVETVQRGGDYTHIASRAKAAVDTWRMDKTQVDEDFRRMQQTMGTEARPAAGQRTEVASARTQVRGAEPSPGAAKKGGVPLPLILGLLAVVIIVIGAVVLLPMMQGGAPPLPSERGRDSGATEAEPGGSLTGIMFALDGDDGLTAHIVDEDGDPEALFPERPEIMAGALAIAWNDTIQRFLIEQEDGSLITVNSFGYEDVMIWQEERGQQAGPKMASWSEDGSRVIFIRVNAGNQFEIVIVQVNDIGMPEGSAIALSSENRLVYPTFVPGERNEFVYGEENGGTMVGYLRLGDETDMLFSFPGSVDGFVLGPDGALIACLVTVDDVPRIQVYDTESGRQLWQHLGDPHPDLIFAGPDNRLIYFTTGEERKTGIWSIPFSGGHPGLISDIKEKGLIVPAGWMRD